MPLRTTLLRHEPGLGGPEPHFDWLLEPDDREADSDLRDVTTWRCLHRPDRLEIGESTLLTPISAHRRAWLESSTGTCRSLTPPLGSATVVSRGMAALTGTDPLELRITWSQSPEVHRIRIEEPAPGRHLALRLTESSNPSSPDEHLGVP